MTQAQEHAGAFVGRSAELRELADLLASSRLVTVVGPGGMGKTRLALEVASQTRRTVVVELADLPVGAGAGQVATAVADALGVSPPPGSSARESLRALWPGDPLLLLLDNAEHVAAAVAEVVDLVAPTTTVLVTSRVPLGRPVERVLRLGGLESADARSLLLHRAGDWTGDVARLDELCSLLDRAPLALAVAGSRLAEAGYDSLRAGLDRELLATAGSALQVAYAWSLDLLTPRQRLLWERLSVFAGHVGLRGIAAVCCDERVREEDLRELLDGLVRASLLQHHADEERWALHETAREAGAARLAASGDLPRCLELHAAWGRQRAMEGYLQVDGMRYERRDLPDLEKALRWYADAGRADDWGVTAMGLLRALGYFGMFARALTLVAEVEATELPPGDGRVFALGGAARVLTRAGDAARALRLLDQAVSDPVATDDDALGLARFERARNLAEHDLDAGMAQMQEMLLWPEEERGGITHLLLSDLSALHLRRGDVEAAERQVRAMLALPDLHEAPTTRLSATLRIAQIADVRDDPGAVTAYVQAAATAEDRDDPTFALHAQLALVRLRNDETDRLALGALLSSQLQHGLPAAYRWVVPSAWVAWVIGAHDLAERLAAVARSLEDIGQATWPPPVGLEALDAVALPVRGARWLSAREDPSAGRALLAELAEKLAQ